MERIFNEIVRHAGFEKDLKKLAKRFRSLPDDLEVFVQYQLKLYHRLGIDNAGIFHIPGLPFSTPRIFKAKKFACKALKGRGAQSGIRVIYAYFAAEDRIEFVELYFKGDQENEDRRRILTLYGTV